eukprot:6686095-Prymnesium_polylepis.1
MAQDLSLRNGDTRPGDGKKRWQQRRPTTPSPACGLCSRLFAGRDAREIAMGKGREPGRAGAQRSEGGLA